MQPNILNNFYNMWTNLHQEFPKLMDKPETLCLHTLELQ